MRIPLPLIAALVIGTTATLYVTLHVIPPPFIPTIPSSDIVLNLSETRWVIAGPLYGRVITVVSNVSVDVVMGEPSAVAVYLPAMPSEHMKYHAYRGRYHVINKSGIYAVVANEVCFAGEAVRQPSGIILIVPRPIHDRDYNTYMSVCGIVEGVGLWNGRIDVIDGSPPTMVFYLHGGGVARGTDLKEEFGRWEFLQHYVVNTTYVRFYMGPDLRMHGRYWNGTMYYDNIDKMVWIAVKPNKVGAQVRIVVR
jgi:hypothetical protein